MHELRDEAVSYNFPSCYSIQISDKIFLKAWESFKTFPHFGATFPSVHLSQKVHLLWHLITDKPLTLNLSPFRYHFQCEYNPWLPAQMDLLAPACWWWKLINQTNKPEGSDVRKHVGMWKCMGNVAVWMDFRFFVFVI